ncbi:MAG: CDC27 family protein [Schleiferiaceae bacterium]|nr:CDC27 family protein [Schleiferiaceae bacterium]
MSTSVQAQSAPRGSEARFVSQDLKALSLYFEGMAILEEGKKGKPFKLFEKAKGRIEKRVKSNQLNSGDLAVWFNIERITGNSDEMLRLGRFSVFLGGEFVNEDLISTCAQYAYSDGDLQGAVFFLKKGDRFLPPSMDRSAAIANLYGKMGEVDSALATMARLFVYPEFEIDAGIRYSMLLNDFGLDNEAYIALEVLMERFPEAMGIQLARAKFLQGSEREAEALGAFEAIYRNVDFSEVAIAQDFLVILGELTQADLPKDHPAWKALLRFSALAAEVRPESALLMRTRGDLLHSFGDKNAALIAYQHSLSCPGGQLWETYEAIAVKQHELGDLAEYLVTAFDANEAFPDHERAALLLGTALDMNGQHAQGITTFLLGLRRSQSQNQGNSPLAPEYHFRLGTAYFHAGDVENMSASMDRLLLFFPDHPQAKNNYAYYLACFGVRLDEAKTMVEAALQMQPENANYWDSYAYVSMQQGKWTTAFEAINECLKWGGDQSADACVHAAQIFFHLDHGQEAETYLNKALENGASEEAIRAIRNQLSQTQI